MATINIVNGPGIWEVMQAYFNYTEETGSVRIPTRRLDLVIELEEEELQQLRTTRGSTIPASLQRKVDISIESLRRSQEGSRILHDLSGCLYIQEDDFHLFSVLMGVPVNKGSGLTYIAASYDLRHRRGVLWFGR